jgi:hypothetical protein
MTDTQTRGTLTIDEVRAQSRHVADRAIELAELLDLDGPTVDMARIDAAQMHDHELAALIAPARAEVVKRLERGDDAGCPLGPAGPIRGVPANVWKLDALQGRVAVVTEPLRAAASEQIDRIRRRASWHTEGGELLERSLDAWSKRWEAARTRQREGDQITAAAVVALEALERAAMMGAVEAEGGAAAIAQMDSAILARAAQRVGPIIDAQLTPPPTPPPPRRRASAGRNLP